MSNSSHLYFDAVKNLHKIIKYIEGSDSNSIFNCSQNIRIIIDSEIPIGGGLGSSSALCVALIGALYCNLGDGLNRQFICDKSIEMEKLINYNTSGVDCSICTYGGLGIYNKASGFSKLGIDMNAFRFLIIDTGIPHNTFEMVNKVKRIKEMDVEFFGNLCKQYEDIYSSSIESLKSRNLERLGMLMDENHSILKKLSLSNTTIDKIIKTCQLGGAYGTKLTGAGGGGCLLSLVDKQDKSHANRLLKKLDELKLDYFFVNPDNSGVRIKKGIAGNTS
jgi:mevalonate kinase